MFWPAIMHSSDVRAVIMEGFTNNGDNLFIPRTINSHILIRFSILSGCSSGSGVKYLNCMNYLTQYHTTFNVYQDLMVLW